MRSSIDHTHSLPASASCSWALALLLLLAPSAAASNPAVPAPHHEHLLVAGIGKDLGNFIQNNLNSRARMIQFSMVGVAIGLWVIWWRR